MVYTAVISCALLLMVVSAESLRPETKKLTLKKPYVYHPENFVDINGTNYYFVSEGVISDWFNTEDFCRVGGMTMVGLETWEEFNDVSNYMQSMGLSDHYWTSGKWSVNSTWTWSDSGVNFDEADPRWAVKEPGSNDRHGVSLHVLNRVFLGEYFDTNNFAMCEGTPSVKLH